MNHNHMSIIFLAGKFGIVIREHVQSLIYTNTYNHISANRTLSKLVDLKLLKRIDRGKRKTDGYKLTKEGIKLYKKHFFEEPKNYNSGDKLQHSIQIVNFYIHMINDLKNRYNIEEINLMEEKRILFKSERQLKYVIKDKIEYIIPDAFAIYKTSSNRAKVFYLEIENSERSPLYVAKKTIKNYEEYYMSAQWKKEKWQNKEKQVFPLILIVSYSEFKARQLIKEFDKKLKIRNLQNLFLFTDYKSLKENGLSSNNIWKNIKGESVSLL